MDIGQYIARIRADQPIRNNAETLRELAIAHQIAVPYENFDNHLGIPVVLDIDAIYQKIVCRGRGGGCYELNALFGTLLRRLGYRVDFLAGRVFGRGYRGKEFDHLTLRVYVGETQFMVDVGFGNGFFEPMQLCDESRSTHGQRQFRLFKFNDHYRLESGRNGELDKGLHFSLTPRRLDEFSKMNRYHSLNPMSLRSQKLIAIRATPTGTLALVGYKRTERQPDSTKTREIGSTEYLETLRTDFGVEIPYIPRVKATRLAPRCHRQLQIAIHRVRKLWSILATSITKTKSRSESDNIDV